MGVSRWGAAISLCEIIFVCMVYRVTVDEVFGLTSSDRERYRKSCWISEVVDDQFQYLVVNEVVWSAVKCGWRVGRGAADLLVDGSGK